MSNTSDNLERALHDLYHTRPFYASLIQVMQINYMNSATLGVRFNNTLKRYELFINPKFFDNMTNENRVACLIHEVEHIERGHLTRFNFTEDKPKEQKEKENVAMDIAINPSIENLPEGVLYPSQFELPNGNTAEWYLENLPENYKEMMKQSGNGQEVNEHNWGEGALESDLVDAAEDLIKRAMTKCSYDYNNLSRGFQEYLDELDVKRKSLNYKWILMKAMKSNVKTNDRVYIWNRSNKRYGFAAKGTSDGKKPMLYNFIDSSGSISIDECNEFIGIVDEFLKVGAKKCMLGMFHDFLYYLKPYKKGQKFDRKVVESGGTDLTKVLECIAKNSPDLGIILTDGYFGNVDIKSFLKGGKKMSRVIFLISKDGTLDHPFKNEDWAINIKIPK